MQNKVKLKLKLKSVSLLTFVWSVFTNRSFCCLLDWITVLFFCKREATHGDIRSRTSIEMAREAGESCLAGRVRRVRHRGSRDARERISLTALCVFRIGTQSMGAFETFSHHFCERVTLYSSRSWK